MLVLIAALAWWLHGQLTGSLPLLDGVQPLREQLSRRDPKMPNAAPVARVAMRKPEPRWATVPFQYQGRGGAL